MMRTEEMRYRLANHVAVDHTISVSGSASMAVTPSHLTVRLETSATESSTTGTQQALEVQTKQLHDSLASVGVEPEQMELTGYSVAATREDSPREVEAAVAGRAEFQFAADRETVRAATEPIIRAGGSIRAVTPTVSRHKLHEVQEELVGAAMRDARRQAERIAAAEGMAIDEMVSAEPRESPTQAEPATHPLPTAHRGDVHPGPIELHHSIEVTYALASE